MHSHPFFSIITATKNAAITLPRLLQSLARQSCRDFELIVQDALSTDNTLALATTWRDRLPFLSAVSESDTGIYDAWNKALPRVRGTWTLFLGADDRLAAPDTLAAVARSLDSLPESVIYAAGNQVYVTLDECPIHSQQPCDLDIFTHLADTPVPHSALFHRSSLFAEYIFDTSYYILGDYDFICRTLHSDDSICNLHMDITSMYLGGTTTSPQHMLAARRELDRLRQRYFPPLSGPQRVTAALKTALVHASYKVLGNAGAARLLNALRRFRHMPPTWG